MLRSDWGRGKTDQKRLPHPWCKRAPGIRELCKAAGTFRESLLLLDQYFLSTPTLQKLACINQEGLCIWKLWQRPKSCTAFEKPDPKKTGRGRLRKKGGAVHLKELFALHKEQFQETGMSCTGRWSLSAGIALVCSGARNYTSSFVCPSGVWRKTVYSWLAPAGPWNNC